MNEYRITKYDPALRSPSGSYMADEWTSYSDIGRSFGGVILTEHEYKRVEDAYIDAAVAFLTEANLTSITVQGLENRRKQYLAVHEGSVLTLEEAGAVIRAVLREEFWCRLQNERGYVHFGWDYYMYLGTPDRCPAAEQKAAALGLYVEEFESPYRYSSNE